MLVCTQPDCIARADLTCLKTHQCGHV